MRAYARTCMWTAAGVQVSVDQVDNRNVRELGNVWAESHARLVIS